MSNSNFLQQLKPPNQPNFPPEQEVWLNNYISNLQQHFTHEIQGAVQSAVQGASEHHQQEVDSLRAAIREFQTVGRAEVEKGVKETLACLGFLGPGQRLPSSAPNLPLQQIGPQAGPQNFAPPPSFPHASTPNHPPPIGQPQSHHHPNPPIPSKLDSAMGGTEDPPPSPSASSSRSTEGSTTSSETFTPRANGKGADPQNFNRPNLEPLPPQSSPTSHPNLNSSSGTSQPSNAEKKPIQYMTEFLGSISPVKPKKKASRQKPLREKKPSEQFRIRKGALAEDQELLQDALFLWLRVIWGMLNKGELPTCPTMDELLVFNTHMRSIEQLNQTRTTPGTGLIPETMVNLNNRASFHFGRKNSRNARNASKLSNSFLQHTAGQLARYGMVRWCPDLRSPHDSLYNKACQYIAIDTFQSGLIQGAFNFLGCSSKYADDIGLLTHLYHHAVFHYFYEVWVLEGRNEGQHAKVIANNAVYQDRIRRSESRLKFMVENRYPPRYQAMCDAKATSEDEMDPVTKRHWRKRRPERSEVAETFFRQLEEVMKRQALANGKVWVEREEHPLQAVSSFTTLPMGMPLDYYSPETWKTLTPAQRYKALLGLDGKGRPKIAFLPKPEHSFGQGDQASATLEKLSDDDFFNARSEAIFPLYNFDIDDLLSPESQDEMQTDI
ncbi:hypothetical protein AAF712_012032 [Marasmius tenuissimus]|uniref:Uncharacterized protein n=1 Tax=Marasmius tenuissimus TaxID=585030 RepID=A0ABR2ZIW8_9AGAR